MVKPVLPPEITTPPQPPLFESLMPYAVRQAIGLYNERKNTQISKQLITEWEGITSQGHALLRELGLPGSLQAIEVPLGLPPSLLTHMEDVKTKGGIQKLKQMRTDVRNLCSSDKQIYEQVIPFENHCDFRLLSRCKRKRERTLPFGQSMGLKDGLEHHQKRPRNLFVNKGTGLVSSCRKQKTATEWSARNFLNGRISSLCCLDRGYLY